MADKALIVCIAGPAFNRHCYQQICAVNAHAQLDNHLTPNSDDFSDLFRCCCVVMKWRAKNPGSLCAPIALERVPMPTLRTGMRAAICQWRPLH